MPACEAPSRESKRRLQDASSIVRHLGVEGMGSTRNNAMVVGCAQGGGPSLQITHRRFRISGVMGDVFLGVWLLLVPCSSLAKAKASDTPASTKCRTSKRG